jgi:hypothetical protein
MNKILKVLTVLTILGLILGLKAISDNNNVFNDVDAVCCDNGLCNYQFPGQTTKCTSTSTMSPKSFCQEITLTCKDCVDLTISSCLCYQGSTSCLKTDGTIYYGVIIPCNIDK